MFSLLPDNNNKLWIAGFTGLSVFDLQQRTFRTFTKEQGLLNAGCAAFVYGRSRFSNLIFFGGNLGVDYFCPDSIASNRFVPRVCFTDFKLFNEPVPIAPQDSVEDGRFCLPQHIGHTRQIALRYDQNVLTFGFAALDYSAPQTVQYAYRLVGFDKDWQYVGSKRDVTFTNLNPGSYTLKVKASNGDGIWDPEESNVNTIQITIAPPWWRTWTFQIAALLLLASLAVALYKYRVGQIRHQSELNQRIAQVKMEALRSQMNPHFVFNCLSSLKLLVEKKESEKASDHISKFAALLRRVLDDARTETETVALERELDTLKRYVEMELIRFKDKFEFVLEVAPNVDLQAIEIPPLILQPYVENAILHGLQLKTNCKGLLRVQVAQNAGSVRISVEDNGVGRAAAMAVKAKNPTIQHSHGLNVTAERLAYYAQKHGADASVETVDLFHPDGSAAGTRVTLTFQTD